MANHCFRCGKKKPIFSKWKEDLCPECLEEIRRAHEETRRQLEPEEQRRREKARKENARALKETQQRLASEGFVWSAEWTYLTALKGALSALEVLPESELAEITHGYTDDDQPRHVFTQSNPVLPLEEAAAEVRRWSEGAPVVAPSAGYQAPPVSLIVRVSSRMITLQKVKRYETGSLWFPCYVVRTAKGYLVTELWCR